VLERADGAAAARDDDPRVVAHAGPLDARDFLGALVDDAGRPSDAYAR